MRTLPTQEYSKLSRLILNKQSATPATPSTNKAAMFIDNTASPYFKFVDEAGNVYYFQDAKRFGNASVAAAGSAYAADTYLAGSAIAIPAGAWKAGTQYQCTLDLTKTGAGTATPIFQVRMGTLGTTGDASIATLTFAVGTANADAGIVDIWVNFRSIGSGTAAVIQVGGRITHHLAATGLTTTGASGTGIILATSSGFNSTTQTTIGVSFNGGTSFSGTNTFVQSTLSGI